MYSLLSMFVTILIYWKSCHPSFHLYNTEFGNNNDQIEYDCLYYQVLDDIVVDYMDEDHFSHPYQVLAYCLRPLIRKDYSKQIRNRFLTNFTFETLRKTHVTSLQLLNWSAPIDLVERYENYLNKPNEQEANNVYYQCPSFQFGEFCQYEFLSNNQFSDVVKLAFQSKSSIFDLTRERSCYPHLKCVPYAFYACLDWREICDGNSDCEDGIDEEDCFEVDLTRCTSNEYRCQNGMCIPGEFFDDNSLNPDCLDGTDEINPSKIDYYVHRCYQDPSFRCEERTRMKGVGFSCGDGQFLNRFEFPQPLIPTCHNGREFIHYQDYQRSIHTDESIPYCWRVVACILSTDRLSWIFKQYKDPDNILFDPCSEYFDHQCSYSYATSRVVWGGHIYLFYDTFNSHLLLPSRVCFDRNYCHFSQYQSYYNRSCLSTTTEFWMDTIDQINSIVNNCTDLFSNINPFDCQMDFAYQCMNSSKCIPKFRLSFW